MLLKKVLDSILKNNKLSVIHVMLFNCKIQLFKANEIISKGVLCHLAHTTHDEKHVHNL